MSHAGFVAPFLAIFGGLGVPEIIIIGGVALLLFGKRLPEVAKSMGRSIVQFKKGLREVETDIDAAADEKEPPEKPKSIPADKDQKEPE